MEFKTETNVKNCGSTSGGSRSRGLSDLPDDFVSADVSEALQEARQIVTEGRARENPNERLIEDYATVKVTKTGSRFEPMEVTVCRRRIVSPTEEIEDPGSFSDSDVELFRKRSISTHKCSLGTANAGLGQLRVGSHDALHSNDIDRPPSHTTVRYRRKHDDFWRRADPDENASNVDIGVVKEKGSVSTLNNADEEDEAQLEIDVKEECRTDDGTHLIIKKWEARWTVQTFDLLPEWLQDNEFLRTGHRPPLPSFVECFKSIWSLHTETGNIWTHLIGCVAFFLLAAWFLTRPDTHIQLQEKFVFSFFFGGAILCLGLSFTFHTVSCHSVSVVKIFSKLDYMGISLLIVGSFIPWIYYGFYCRREPKISYIAMVVVLGVGAVIVSLWDKFGEKRYRPFRAGVFVSMGLSGLIPTVHFVVTDGMRRLIDENSFYWLMAMAALYLVGALLYATRTPERFFPGKFDIWFQSHQLFHLCVVCAAFAHYYGISEMAMNRLTGGSCDLREHSSSTARHLIDEL